MVPKTGTAAYRYLVFIVDGKSGMVKQTIIYDQTGGTNRLRFGDVQQNRGVDDGKFKFAPPSGAICVPEALPACALFSMKTVPPPSLSTASGNDPGCHGMPVLCGSSAFVTAWQVVQ